MNVVIRLEESDRARAWGFLVRHSPGSALPNNTFIVSEEAARGMREAGIGFTGLLDTHRSASRERQRPE
jgi:hypothetical protein